MIWYLLPLLLCFTFMGERGGAPQETGKESESFYTTQGIQDSFESIEKKIDEWRQESLKKTEEPRGFKAMLGGLLRRGPPPERFVEKENKPPQLISLEDSSGRIFFEFTEVEGGGTVVKATYGLSLKERIAKMKTGLSLKIPATPIGLKCPSCGKPVLHEFNLCPYCGTDLIKE